MLLQRKDLVKLVYNFFLSKDLDNDYFNEIVDFLTEKAKNDTEKTRVKFGMFSFIHFLTFISQTNRIKRGVNSMVVRFTLETLEEKLLLKRADLITIGEIAYESTGEYVKVLNKYGLIENTLFGFEFIINRYRNSVFKVENTANNNAMDIGTGFLHIRGKDELLVTNYHVLENAKKIKVYDVDDKEILFELLHSNSENDIALVKLKRKCDSPNGFIFNPVQKVLSEIITIGYPSIPMAKEAYQIYHKGEINSHMEDYRGNKLFLISAKTSSGNSGSPVIDKNGLVVGMVARELFEKGALLEKGKLAYIGVIPSDTIENEINKYYAQRV